MSLMLRNLLAKNNYDETSKYACVSVHKELNRFFIHPDKPLILALCRPDKRKNIDGLILCLWRRSRSSNHDQLSRICGDS